MADPKLTLQLGATLNDGFGKSFERANSSVRGLGATAKATEQALGSMESHSKLEAQFRKASTSADEARAKTEAYRKEIAGLKEPTEKQVRELAKLEKQEQRATAAQQRLGGEMTRSKDAMQRLGIDTSRLSEEHARLSREAERAARAMRGLQQIKSAQLGQAFANVRQSGVSAFRDIGMAVGLAGGALLGTAKFTATYGDEVAKAARVLGMSTDAFQEFRFIGERSGVSMQQMDEALKKLTVNMGRAAQGTGATGEALERLGLDAQTLAAAGAEKAMYMIAERMKRIPNEAQRAALAVDIFGRAGARMGNVLAEGSKGLDALRVRARQLGFVIGKDGLDSAERFQDMWLDVGLAMRGVRNTIGVALMPTFSNMFEKMSNWIAGNGAKVEAWATRLGAKMEELAPKAIEIGSAMASMGEKLFIAAEGLSRMVGGWENLGLLVIGARLIPLAVAVGKLGASLFGAAKGLFMLVSAGGTLGTVFPGLTVAAGGFGAALAATPIGWVIAGIAVIVAGVALAIHYWEQLSQIASGWGEGFMDSIRPIVDGFRPIGEVISWVAGGIWDLIGAIDSSAKSMDAWKDIGYVMGRVAGYVAMAMTSVLIPLSKVSSMMGWIGKKVGIGPWSGKEGGGDSIDNLAVPAATSKSVSQSNQNSYQFKIEGAGDPAKVVDDMKRYIEQIERDRNAENSSNLTDSLAYQ
jgi:hypothetical protein